MDSISSTSEQWLRSRIEQNSTKLDALMEQNAQLRKQNAKNENHLENLEKQNAKNENHLENLEKQNGMLLTKISEVIKQNTDGLPPKLFEGADKRAQRKQQKSGKRRGTTRVVPRPVPAAMFDFKYP